MTSINWYLYPVREYNCKGAIALQSVKKICYHSGVQGTSQIFNTNSNITNRTFLTGFSAETKFRLPILPFTALKNHWVTCQEWKITYGTLLFKGYGAEDGFLRCNVTAYPPARNISEFVKCIQQSFDEMFEVLDGRLPRK